MVSQQHWELWIYRQVARHWQALWCRWAPTGELQSRFRAERIFAPCDGGTDMSVVYHYEDERGTVREGPACGPWRITEAQSRADGIEHPSSNAMTTLLLPGGPSAWCMKASKLGHQPCAVELFLHHGEHLRMSAGVIHAVDGSLKQCSLIREDSRAPFPSPGWSESTDALATDTEGLAGALARAGAPTACGGGSGHVITSSLEQSAVTAVDWGATRMGSVGADDTILLCDEGRVAIVAPTRRREGAGWSSATAWWPSDADGATTTSRLYTIEAHWDVSGALTQVRHLVFAREGGAAM